MKLERAIGLGPIDWTNAVAVPLLLGLPLAIYAGLIASRIFAFYQVRAKAVHWMLGLGGFFREEFPSPHEFSVKLGQSTQGIMLELRAYGHEEAAQQIGVIFLLYLKECAKLVGVPVPSSGIPNFTSPLPEVIWRLRLADLRDFFLARVGGDIAHVATLKPNTWALLTLNPFPDCLSANGNLIGLLVPRPSPWRRLILKWHTATCRFSTCRNRKSTAGISPNQNG